MFTGENHVLLRAAVALGIAGMLIGAPWAIAQQQPPSDTRESQFLGTSDTCVPTISTDLSASIMRLNASIKENAKARSTLNSAISDLLLSMPPRSE